MSLDNLSCWLGLAEDVLHRQKWWSLEEGQDRWLPANLFAL